MATLNPFDLLNDDAEDPSQLVVAKPRVAAPVQPAKAAKMPTKPLPPSQAVREAKNAPGGGRGGGRGRGDGGYGRGDGGYGRGRGGYNRDNRNNDAPANENGYGGGGYRRSEEGDGARRGGPAGGYRGGRRGGFNNGESGDFERPRRNYERHSGTGHGNEFKRDGAGRGNWGTNEDEVAPVTEDSTAVVEKSLDAEKQGGEGEATDAKKEKPLAEQEAKEPEIETMSLEEYEKVLEEKRKALQAVKIEERKVDTKAFESMQQLSSKKSNNDEVFIKLGTEKDKRVTEREEKAKKSLSINEFLKPAEGESFNRRGGYRGGRGGRGGPRGGGNQRYGGGAAPAIGDTAQFPTLGK